jgi:hypothetical protein
MKNKLEITRDDSGRIAKIVLNGAEIWATGFVIDASIESPTTVTITLTCCEVDANIPESC